MSYTEADVSRLGERLDALEFSDGERAALRALLTFAAQHPGDIDGLDATSPDLQLKRVLPSLLFEPELL